ncbi:hypothetical protein OA07_23065 [Aphanizomenon flos-aquae 2012/KM1/D3]|nr:hypothetical protein OA07_23065 [Aphanizomenon flos-aquae 2012/KM1/D3]
MFTGIVGVTEEIEMLVTALQITLIEPVEPPDAVLNVLLAILYPNKPAVFVASLNKQVAGTSSEIVTVAVSAEAFEATPRELTKVNVARAKKRRKFLGMDLVWIMEIVGFNQQQEMLLLILLTF